ncbi:MAG: hypothetical protein QF387_08030, partial [Arenicellales bacterium]|nr:hypothetical protein [Arenicellales bacterium]
MDSLIAHPRVQIGIEQVDEEIEPHHPGGKDQVDAGDHRVVPVFKGNHYETAQPRQVKDVLHDHGAAYQEGQLRAYQGDYRDQGILDGVSHDNHALPETLGPGRPDVVLPEHLQHHGARHPHGAGGKGRPQNQAGNDQDPQVAPRVFGKRHQLHRGRPAPPDGRV